MSNHRFHKLILAILLAITSLAAVASGTTATFNNRCTYTACCWKAPGSIEDAAYFEVPAGGQYSYDIDQDIGYSVKCRDLPHYQTQPAGIAQLGYTQNYDQLWYDLSFLGCNKAPNPHDPYYCPFLSGGVKMYTADGDCPAPACQIPGICPETATLNGTYVSVRTGPDEPSLHCQGLHNIIVDLCFVSVGVQSMETDPKYLDAEKQGPPAAPWKDEATWDDQPLAEPEVKPYFRKLPFP